MISIMVLVFAVVTALDWATTEEGLDRWLIEANPVLAWLIRAMGKVGLWVGVLGFELVCLACILGLYEWRHWAGYALGVACIAWRGVVVYHNFKILKGEK